MLASVIIPTFKRAGLLKLGLRSLSEQDCVDELEVIVLNDGVEDNTREICESSDLDVRYVFTGQRNSSGLIWRIPGFAINIGVKLSSCSAIMLTCPEIYHISESSMSKLLAPVLADRKVLSTPKKVHDDQTGDVLRSIGDGQPDVSKCKVVNGAFVANPEMPYAMAMRKQDFCDIGGYDEDFTGISADDNDFVDRMRAFGCAYEFCDTEIVHLYHGIGSATEKFKDPRYQYNVSLWRSRKGQIVRNIGREWGTQ